MPLNPNKQSYKQILTLLRLVVEKKLFLISAVNLYGIKANPSFS